MSYNKVAELQSRVIIGTKQTLKAMREQEVSEVFIANDVDQHIKDKVIQLAKELGIHYEIVDSKKKLGTACGIDVGAATVAIKHE